MTERKAVSGADLIAGIVKGQVPRQVRLFAAQGLLPISREELLGLQCVLSSDPNEELAKVAADSVRGEEVDTILDWLRDQPPESLVLDQLIRVREEEAIWAGVALRRWWRLRPSRRRACSPRRSDTRSRSRRARPSACAGPR